MAGMFLALMHFFMVLDVHGVNSISYAFNNDLWITIHKPKLCLQHGFNVFNT